MDKKTFLGERLGTFIIPFHALSVGSWKRQILIKYTGLLNDQSYSGLTRSPREEVSSVLPLVFRTGGRGLESSRQDSGLRTQTQK